MAINTKVWAPVATFVAVLGIGGAAVLMSGGGDGPRPLRLADAGTSARDAASLSAPAVAGGTAQGGWTLTGSLPEGRPDEAPAWDQPKGPGTAGPVARLAEALGEGTPQRDGEGWRAGGLSVSGEAGRSWWWSPCGGAVAKGAPETAVSSDAAYSSTLTCALDTPVAVGSTGSGGASVGTATADPAPAPPSDGGTSGSGTAPAPVTGGPAVLPPARRPSPRRRARAPSAPRRPPSSRRWASTTQSCRSTRAAAP